MKNLATPPRQRSPRSSRSARPPLELVPGRVRLDVERSHDAHAQLSPRLELAQLAERGRRAVHRVHGGQAGFGQSAQCFGAAPIPLGGRRPGHRALDEAARGRLEQRAGGAALPADHLGAARKRPRTVDARRRERSGRGERGVEVEEREQRRCAAYRVRDQRAVQLGAVEGRVLERMATHPLPRGTARSLGSQRSAHLVQRREAREVGADRVVGPHERMLVGVHEAGDESDPAAVDHLGARIAGRAHLGVVADRDDHPAARRDGSRPGPCGIERPDARSEHCEVCRVAHRCEPTGRIAAMATATTPWRAALTFAVTDGFIAISYGVRARSASR